MVSREPALVSTGGWGSFLYRGGGLVGPAAAAAPPTWVGGVVVATLLLVLGEGSRLARVSAAFRESSAPLVHHHESARSPGAGAGVARGEAELPPRIACSGMTSPNPQFSSTRPAPLDIRRW